MEAIEHAVTFLKRLHTDNRGLIEVRALRKREMGRQFFDSRWPQDAIEYAFAMNRFGFGVYCGVNLRRVPGGTERDVANVSSLFLDLDNSKCDPKRNYDKLAAFNIAPSVIVASGNGAHFYFRLSQPMTCSEGKLLGRRLCDATESDRVFDTTRIARLPGTYNWKTDPPHPCLLAGATRRDYTPHEIAAALDRMGVPEVEPQPDVVPTMGPQDPLFDWFSLKEKLDPAVVDLITFGEKHSHLPSRSEADYRVVRALVAAGATDAQIRHVYATEEIGRLKYREKGNRYLETTIREARRDSATPIRLRRNAIRGTKLARSVNCRPTRQLR